MTISQCTVVYIYDSIPLFQAKNFLISKSDVVTTCKMYSEHVHTFIQMKNNLDRQNKESEKS